MQRHSLTLVFRSFIAALLLPLISDNGFRAFMTGQEEKSSTNLQEIGQAEIDVSRLLWNFAVSNIHMRNDGQEQ